MTDSRGAVAVGAGLPDDRWDDASPRFFVGDDLGVGGHVGLDAAAEVHREVGVGAEVDEPRPRSGLAAEVEAAVDLPERKVKKSAKRG